jgi:hypothetical protein
MAKLNARGDFILGVAGIQGSLNGHWYPFKSEGRGCWLDEDTILVAAVDHGPGVWRWQPFADPHGTDLKRIDPRAFNKIAGGGGRWAATIQGGKPLMFGSLGDMPGAGVADVALDGTLVYQPDYFSNFGLTIVPPTGNVRVRPDAVAIWYYAVPAGQAIWPGGADGRPAPKPALGSVDLRLAELDGEAWLLYWSEGVGLILQPDGATEGYTIALPNGYDNDLIALGGELVAAIGTTQGEGPNDVLILRANRHGARYTFGSGPVPTWGPLKATEPPVEPPVKPPPVEPPVKPPVPPKPKPPEPPKPPPGPFKPAVRFEVPMSEPVRYAFRLGQFFASIKPGDVFPKGHPLAGWHRVHFKRESLRTDPECEFLVSQPRAGDPKLLLRHSLTDTVMSADATEHSGNIEEEFSSKPGVTDETWGGYEAWDGWAHGTIDTVRVTYDRDGEQYESAGLTAVKL